MGTADPSEVYKGERPQRLVTLPKPFAVGRTHVTRAQFSAFVEARRYEIGRGCSMAEGGSWKIDPNLFWQSPGFFQTEQDPVVCVSWLDAKAYVDWLSEHTGERYRLMTEAEAEYIARAAHQPPGEAPFGAAEKDICKHANGLDASATIAIPNVRPLACADGFSFTSPVGTFKANPFGVYDSVGNVWSWTEDCWTADYAGRTQDSLAYIVPNCAERVLRGGAWRNNAWALRPAYRGHGRPEMRNYNQGFRVAKTL